MRYTYGAFGMLEKTTDADLRYTKYKYDLGQNAVSITDRNSNETLCTYDNRNLLLTKSVAQTGDSISCSYDAVGNRTGMTDATGSSTYTYDVLNRLLNITKGGILQITYTYDTIGNIATVKDKKANTTTYTYDKCSRMSTVSCTVAGVANITTYTYDANGNRQSIAYQGGVKEEYTYNKNNKLLTLTNKKPDGSTISSYSYTYDLAGRQKTKTDGYGQSTYTYDGAGRITQATTPGKTSIYTYDGAGNRTALTETYTSEQSSGYIDEATGNEIRYIIKEEQYTYISANKLIKLSEKMKDSSGAELLEKITAYNYDYNGNQTYQTASYKKLYDPTMQEELGTTAIQDSTSTYENNLEITHNEYDGFNRLKKADIIKAGARTITTYNYDGDDLRTSKTTKSSANNYQPITTNYQYDRQHVILETDATDAIKARYIRGINYIARIDAANKLSYYLYNGHGDIVQTASGLGVVENQYDYDIFGNPTLTIEQYANAIRYAGEFYDTETGLYYLRARYYDPYTGRFISEDSYWGEDSNPLSLNLYTYCANNPIMFIDPTGHVFTKWDDEHVTSAADRAAILALTKAWAEATTAKDRKDAHDAAEKIRNKYRGTEYVGSDDGTTYRKKDNRDKQHKKLLEGAIYADIKGFYKKNDEAHYTTNIKGYNDKTRLGKIDIYSIIKGTGGTGLKGDGFVIAPVSQDISNSLFWSDKLPLIPGVNIINDAKIALTHFDLAGVYVTDRQVQDSQVMTLVTFGTAFASLEESAVKTGSTLVDAAADNFKIFKNPKNFKIDLQLFAKNKDRGMVKDAAREVGLEGKQLERFQRQIESFKKMSGKRNDDNFSYSDLLEIAQDIKDSFKR